MLCCLFQLLISLVHSYCKARCADGCQRLIQISTISSISTTHTLTLDSSITGWSQRPVYYAHQNRGTDELLTILTARSYGHIMARLKNASPQHWKCNNKNIHLQNYDSHFWNGMQHTAPIRDLWNGEDTQQTQPGITSSNPVNNGDRQQLHHRFVTWHRQQSVSKSVYAQKFSHEISSKTSPQTQDLSHEISSKMFPQTQDFSHEISSKVSLGLHNHKSFDMKSGAKCL